MNAMQELQHTVYSVPLEHNLPGNSNTGLLWKQNNTQPVLRLAVSC